MPNQKLSAFGDGVIVGGEKVYATRAGADTGLLLGNAAKSDTGKFVSDTGGNLAVARDTGKFISDTGQWTATMARDTGKFVSDTGDALLDNLENQTITGGAAVTLKDLGNITSGTVTLDVGDRPFQRLMNGGAFTLAPGTVKGSTILEVVNDTGGCGVITITGFSGSSGAFDTGKQGVWHCAITVGDSGSFISINEVQAGV